MLSDWQNQLAEALILSQTQVSKPGECPDKYNLPASQGLEACRLALYQELMLNTLLESMQSIYPYTYQVLSSNGQEIETWETLVEVYRRAYPNPSYKLMGAVEHFPCFLSEQSQWMQRYPYLHELALYEWLEMQVLNLPDVSESERELSLPGELPDVSQFDRYSPVWNEARVMQHFDFSIPELIQELQTQPKGKLSEGKLKARLANVSPQATDILIYRDPETLKVRFFCLNGMTSLLIHLSTAQPGAPYGEILRQLQDVAPVLQSLPQPVIMEQAAGLFHTCLENKLLLGSHYSPS